ncbi:MAG: M3 family metallopeptidase [Chitinophagales bacterium]|jgi:M3 family oligoendopeptidase|nr:M3 family metallopeptidase [Sphingobacteriales bacterium]
MQNINTIELVKLDRTKVLASLDGQLEKIKATDNFSDFKSEYKKFQELKNEFGLQYQLNQFRFFGDTTQTELKSNYEFYTQTYPEVIVRDSRLKKIISDSPFMADIKRELGDNLYYDIKNSSYDISEKARELMQRESTLERELVEFKSQSKIQWEGGEIPVSKLYSFVKDSDRQKRKNAFDALATYYTKNKTYFYNKLIELIKIRNAFAKELGYASYVEFSSVKWNRIGYDYTDLKKYRDAVVDNFKEIYQQIFNFKKENLNLDTITYYDNNYFNDGFPQLTEKKEEATISKLKQVLGGLSPNWLSIYQSMLDANSIDYMDRANKVNMGYATYVSEIDTPLIYSQFQNNDTDVRVLTHEFGHTLQFVLSYFENPKKYFVEGTLDTVEIFSHSMEMLCLKDAELFFGKDADKYSILNYSGHLIQAMTCALGDEFQETIYKLEDLSMNSIQAVYRNLQEKYTGNFFDSSENEYFINGDKWMELDHYFGSPFYLIDYSLAIINALNIYKLYKQNPDRGVEIWETLAKNLSNLNYKNITNLTPELKSPFDNSYIEETARFAKKEFSDLLTNYRAAQPAS